MSKLINVYSLRVCRLSDVNDSSVKLFKNPGARVCRDIAHTKKSACCVCVARPLCELMPLRSLIQSHHRHCTSSGFTGCWPEAAKPPPSRLGRSQSGWDQQPYDPAIPLLGTHTKETRTERDTCTPVFIAALFIIARTWKQPRCPSAEEWIRKL